MHPPPPVAPPEVKTWPQKATSGHWPSSPSPTAQGVQVTPSGCKAQFGFNTSF